MKMEVDEENLQYGGQLRSFLGPSQISIDTRNAARAQKNCRVAARQLGVNVRSYEETTAWTKNKFGQLVR